MADPEKAAGVEGGTAIAEGVASNSSATKQKKPPGKKGPKKGSRNAAQADNVSQAQSNMLDASDAVSIQ